MQKKNRIEYRKIIIFLDNSLYTKEAVFKCVYWYGEKFRTSVTTENENYVVILESIEPKIDLAEFLQKSLIQAERDFIDYNLRDIVTKETKNIRELLIAKAFSHGQFDEDPPGQVSDPVGFNVNE